MRIHESPGIRRLGKRKGVILNPGSDYSTGALVPVLGSRCRGLARYPRVVFVLVPWAR